MSQAGLQDAIARMRADGAGDAAIRAFAHYYERLASGERGMIAEHEIAPVDHVDTMEELPERIDRAVLDQAVVLKLNGGLGTSMGMTRAKSLLEVKEGLSFLDIIARQVLHLRCSTGARLPLVLMNSFATRADSLAALAAYDDLPGDVPLDFLQNKVPKLRADDLTPADWPDAPELEWAPPGHGDLYVALVASGMLDALLDAGYRYAFVSNADNLGAVLDPRILSWIAAVRSPFVIEVARRTPADRKGGHIAARADGRLLLREIAQTPEEDLDAFQDIDRHRFFNSNTIWVDLQALQEAFTRHDGVIGLPIIVNRKTIDPKQPDSLEVVQLETAMGAAIDVFEGARALLVPKTRFAPVKTTNDLLGVRSDAYVLTDSGQVVMAPERDGAPLVIDLDPRYYRLLADFDQRFPDGPPSLVEASSFVVRGDITFGADQAFGGDVVLEA